MTSYDSHQLIAEEEGKAVQRSSADNGVSSTEAEQVFIRMYIKYFDTNCCCIQIDRNARSVLSGMKSVLAALAAEISRCKEPNGLT